MYSEKFITAGLFGYKILFTFKAKNNKPSIKNGIVKNSPQQALFEPYLKFRLIGS